MNLQQRISIPAVVLAATIIGLSACGKDANSGDGEITLTTDAEKVSYSIGVQIGQDFKRMKIDDINSNILARAIRDVIGDQELALTEEQMGEIMNAFSTQMQAKMQVEQERMMAENSSAATAFLIENASKEGVVSLPDSVQYIVIQEGSGSKPVTTDTVRVHYTGTLIDGTVFDSSYDKGEPVEFPLDGVIPGWSEVIQLMNVGGKCKAFIPPALAYGPRGMGDRIEPNSLLIFEIELLDIVSE